VDSHAYCVNVSAGGIGEPGRGFMLITRQVGRRACNVVARHDLFEQVGWRRLAHRVRPEDAMWFASDDLQVEVVRGPAAGQHGVELLTGLLTGGQACTVSTERVGRLLSLAMERPATRDAPSGIWKR
jgi:hypothetical protein